MDARVLEGKSGVNGMWNRGSLDGEIERLHASLQMFERQEALNHKEYDALMRLLELHAFLGAWDRVVELASQGIVVGVEPVCELRLYRIWLEALKEDHHVEALRDLARHLMSRRREGMEFVALGMMGNVYCGHMVQARLAFGQLFRLDGWSTLVAECIGTFMCECPDRADRIQGLKMLFRANRRPLAGYFSLRSMLNYAFESDAMGMAEKVLHRLSAMYPQSPDAPEVAVMLAVDEGDWLGAQQALDVLRAINPRRADAVLWQARSLEMRGLKEEARELLVHNADLFPTGDYEFNVAMGMLGRELADEAGQQEMKASAAEYLERALDSASLYHAPEQPLVAALEDLGVFSQMEATREDGSQRFWMLSTDARTLSGILARPGLTIRCPVEMDRNDVIFFSVEERSRGDLAVSGFFRATTPVLLDAAMGPMVRLSEPVAFESDVLLPKDGGLYCACDSQGAVNFSQQRRAFFFEMEKELAEGIINRVEGAHERMRQVG